jgi:hypothetical protein
MTFRVRHVSRRLIHRYMSHIHRIALCVVNVIVPFEIAQWSVQDHVHYDISLESYLISQIQHYFAVSMDYLDIQLQPDVVVAWLSTSIVHELDIVCM